MMVLLKSCYIDVCSLMMNWVLMNHLMKLAFGADLVIPGKHFLILEFRSASALSHRVASQQLYMHPLATYV